ncbi:MAG: hypothetical protein V5A55_12120 [Halovenus sp.]
MSDGGPDTGVLTRRRWLASLAATGVGLAGCTSPLSQEPEPETLFERAFDPESTVDVRGTRREVARRGDEERWRKTRFWERYPEASRVEIIDVGEEGYIFRSVPGTIRVSTETAVWRYDPDSGQAFKTERDRERTESIEEQLAEFDITHEGTETLVGRETHRLVLSLPDDTDGLVPFPILPVSTGAGDDTGLRPTEFEFWIDDEYEYPLKWVQTLTDGAGKLTVRQIQEVESLTFEPEFEEGRFVFDPPEGVEVGEANTPDSVDHYDSLETGRENSPNPVPSAEVPEPYVFSGVTVSERDGRIQTSILYTDGLDGRIFILVRKADMPLQQELTTVGTVEGVLHEHDDEFSFSWNCGQYRYRVSDVETESTLASVVESIGCEGNQD